MTPVDMLCLHDPENGKIGDCFRACIASLLDLPAIDVPHFCDYPGNDDDNKRWYRNLQEWLALHGLTYMEFREDPKAPWDWAAFTAAGWGAYHVMSGQSPRARHSVVALNGVMVHDPHPSRSGLIGPYIDDEDAGLYGHGFIVRRCGA